MIQNVVFDMGGVLIRWIPDEIMECFEVRPEDVPLLKRELFQGVEWVQMDRGLLNGEETAERVRRRLPEHLWPVTREIATGWYRRYLPPMPGMAELLRELRDNGYRLYLLSNASDALRTYFTQIPGSESFQRLLVSGEEKLLKPQHEIYERLCEKFGILPEESWFVDDSPANVEGAMVIGMGGTVFRGDIAHLRRELKQAGIRCDGKDESR